VDVVTLVSPAKVRTVAAALRGLTAPDAFRGAERLVGTPAARASVARLLTAWGQVQAKGDEVAGMLLGASEARVRAQRELNVELVWTGPTTGFVPTRRTEQVLDFPGVAAAMTDAARRGVRVRVLLEASTSHGGSLSVDPAATMRACVPAAEIFTWREKPEPFVDGKVHAKIAVVDGARAFITSANLTGHALEKNMEVGVLVHGGSVPATLKEHLEALIDLKIITRV
jgi:cardiolipin synthase